ncbi:hypothetical protein GCM10022416_33130 [Actinomadura keratinilytica]|uniref:Uncharacterized protein n=1 Tax=Actinomadura keratinilytica TaxID=547461 RepID=A0ABP7Z126_9ACTN
MTVPAAFPPMGPANARKTLALGPLTCVDCPANTAAVSDSDTWNVPRPRAPAGAQGPPLGGRERYRAGYRPWEDFRERDRGSGAD